VHSYAIQESAQGTNVAAENKAYSDLLAAKSGNDNFVHTAAQTLDCMMVLHKVKDVQTQDRECAEMFAQWDTGFLLQAKEDAAAASAATAQPERIATLDNRPRETAPQVSEVHPAVHHHVSLWHYKLQHLLSEQR
jgi:hypothetical protein